MRDFEFQPDWGAVKRGMAGRLREVRMELYGEHGGPMLANELGITFGAWVGYETGATMPASVMLLFLQRTGANPRWLLTGDGPRYSASRKGR
ncbi:hypothetical protein [Paludisphaera sp.]|uniref:hypothetical protein n=1 Tax=Paludisphaera sp. TaxID=2017432 RepID=UPI00301E2B64